MKYYEGIDYWVRYVKFPNMASESVVASHGDGTFTIYINTLFSEERQKDRLMHELNHLEKEHFYRDELTIEQVERQADGIVAKEPADQKQVKMRIPNVFTEHPPNTIPLFNGLDIMMNYIKAFSKQNKRDQAAEVR